MPELRSVSVIDNFTGSYRFLSNFYPCDIFYQGTWYPTLEHAYQAAKTLDSIERHNILICPTAGKAKRLGGEITCQPGWDLMKVDIMRELLRQKFAEPKLRDKLIATGEMKLIEGNYWGDHFWGVCTKPACPGGSNLLGKLLMQIRDEKKAEYLQK